MKTIQEQIYAINWKELTIEDQQKELDQIKKGINRNSKWSDILLCLDVQKSILEDEYVQPCASFRWKGKELMEDVEGLRVLRVGIKSNMKYIDSGRTLMLQSELRFGATSTGIYATIEL